ncbi:hypothetical protein PTKIN_Ptkin02bG0145900 [Pterospermum kingtungense]
MMEKVHFVVYIVDQKRFVLPLEYLKNEIVTELFNLIEEEFGLPGDGLLILPCDATFMEYDVPYTYALEPIIDTTRRSTRLAKPNPKYVE